MVKVEYYRQIFSAFKELCSSGKQSCSFREYCRGHGVNYYRMYLILKEEYTSLNDVPGYTRGSCLKFRCSQAYEEFKSLCADGRQPGRFIDYYKGFGVTRKQMKDFLWRNRLRVSDLPGYTSPHTCRSSRYKEIPFEDVIFEEAGFLPAESCNVITVRVDGNVEVSFPEDTDLSVIAKFIRKMGKEVTHVEP